MILFTSLTEPQQFFAGVIFFEQYVLHHGKNHGIVHIQEHKKLLYSIQ